jgi:hypothetical protein
MSFRGKPWRRTVVAVLLFEAVYILCLLTTGLPFVAPLAFIIAVLVAWDLGLVAGLAWVGLAHVLSPLLMMLAGVGPFFVFSQARLGVAAVQGAGILAEMAMVYLTVRLRALNGQLADSKVELLQANGRLQAALAEVKELRGMLPICAWCKKIRDDGGQWEKIECYLLRNSHVIFSHGVCPDCLEGQLNALQGAAN